MKPAAGIEFFFDFINLSEHNYVKNLADIEIII